MVEKWGKEGEKSEWVKSTGMETFHGPASTLYFDHLSTGRGERLLLLHSCAYFWDHVSPSGPALQRLCQVLFPLSSSQVPARVSLLLWLLGSPLSLQPPIFPSSCTSASANTFLLKKHPNVPLAILLDSASLTQRRVMGIPFTSKQANRNTDG